MQPKYNISEFLSSCPSEICKLSFQTAITCTRIICNDTSEEDFPLMLQYTIIISIYVISNHNYKINRSYQSKLLDDKLSTVVYSKFE
jgi:hypothetical protein